MTKGSLLSDACRAVKPVNWLLLLCPVLIVLLAVDRFWPDYDAVMAENEDLTLQLQRTQAQSQPLQQYIEHLDGKKEIYQRWVGKAYQAKQADQSVAQFTADLHRILGAVYVQPDAPVQVSLEHESSGAAVLTAALQFSCVPQQLHSLELQLLSQSQSIKVMSLVARVVPDPARASQQLLVQLTLKALHASVTEMPPLPQTAKPKP